VIESAAAPWRLFIDTGGTFTDCLGLAPDGSLHRAKVLSSSALRGQVVEVLGENTVKVRGSWPAVDDLLVGLTFRRLEGMASGESREGQRTARKVVGFQAASSVLELEELDQAARDFRGPPSLGSFRPGGLRPEASFELLSPEEAPVLAARLLTGVPLGSALPPLALRLATTRGTNALLERRGARTALLITEGFGDLLHIGTQQRPDLFQLDIRRPAPLPTRVIEVSERLAADGSVLRPLDLEALGPAVDALIRDGFESAAVVLMHSYRRSCHEEHVAAFLRRRGFQDVSCSAELAPRIGFLARAQTAAVDAYLGPVIRRYLERVERALGEGSTLHVMTSAGGLVRARDYRPKDSLLSGPAGGVVGAAAAGRAAGFEEIIAFDMGGTSTDVSRIRGDFEYRHEQVIGGIELLTPALAIETVAAGGGSTCRFDGHRLRVGPESAGASPGPACYGAGGPLTITDVNLLLGRLDPQGFEIPIDPQAAKRAAATLASAVRVAGGGAPGEVPGETADGTPEETLLEGLLKIANERMADAIRTISIRRGYDPRSSVLVAFGGAGPQHACAVAELLGMEEVLIPADAALLSAVGLHAAVLERFAERQVLAPLASLLATIPNWLADLEGQAREQIVQEGAHSESVKLRRQTFHLRFAGQESTLPVEWAAPDEGPVSKGPSSKEPVSKGSLASLEATFRRLHLERFGYCPEDREVELESLVVVVSAQEGQAPRSREVQSRGPGLQDLGAAETQAGSKSRRRAFFSGRWQEVAAVERASLAFDSAVEGPALILERHSATVVEPGWTCRRGLDGSLRLQSLRLQSSRLQALRLQKESER